jgi:hypothetical protein
MLLYLELTNFDVQVINSYIKEVSNGSCNTLYPNKESIFIIVMIKVDGPPNGVDPYNYFNRDFRKNKIYIHKIKITGTQLEII